MIRGASWYQLKEDLHADLRIPTVIEVISYYATKHERGFHAHPNPEALELVLFNLDTRCLKRIKPLQWKKNFTYFESFTLNLQIDELVRHLKHLLPLTSRNVDFLSFELHKFSVKN